MASWTLLAAAAASAVAALLFGAIAVQVANRPRSAAHRSAGIALAISWAALAVQIGSDAARLAIGATSGDLMLYATLARLKILAAAFMIWGFGYYVSYLWTGKNTLNVPILVFALSHAFLFLYLFERRVPTGIATGAWSTRLFFESPGAALPFLPSGFPLIFFYYFLPPILIAIAYLLLVPRFNDHWLRARATAAALAVLSYHGAGLVYFNPQVDLNHGATPAMLGLVLATATLAFLAYRRSGPAPLPPPTARPGSEVTAGTAPER